MLAFWNLDHYDRKIKLCVNKGSYLDTTCRTKWLTDLALVYQGHHSNSHDSVQTLPIWTKLVSINLKWFLLLDWRFFESDLTLLWYRNYGWKLEFRWPKKVSSICFWKCLSVVSKYIGREKSIDVSLVQIGWVLAESLLLEWWPWDTKTKSVSDFLL